MDIEYRASHPGSNPAANPAPAVQPGWRSDSPANMDLFELLTSDHGNCPSVAIFLRNLRLLKIQQNQQTYITSIKKANKQVHHVHWFMAPTIHGRSFCLQNLLACNKEKQSSACCDTKKNFPCSSPLGLPCSGYTDCVATVFVGGSAWAPCWAGNRHQHVKSL